MKTWQIFSIAAAALAAGAGLSVVAQAVASGPVRPVVAAVVPLDHTGNGSGKGVWVVGDDGSVKYCVTGPGKVTGGVLAAPLCSAWNISVRYQAPNVN
jgi:hypothetical protein